MANGDYVILTDPNDGKTYVVPNGFVPNGTSIGSGTNPTPVNNSNLIQFPTNQTTSRQCDECGVWIMANNSVELQREFDHHLQMHEVEKFHNTIIESMFELIDKLSMLADRIDRRTMNE